MSRTPVAGAQLRIVGLAAASLAANALALVFTVVFSRALGEEGYGSLAALLSALLILSVPGTALQIAVARDVASGRYGDGPQLAAIVRRWLVPLLVGTVAVAVASAVGRELAAGAVGVEQPWAAALVLPGAGVWLMLSLLRGVGQGIGTITTVGWSIVGEALGRLACGLLLFAANAGVTAAFAGTPLAMGLAALALGVVLNRRIGAPGAAEPWRLPGRGLGALAGSARTAIFGLTLLTVLQNIDVIVVKHRLDDAAAGSYAAAAVAAKVLIWVAIGLAIHVVPEAAGRAARGEPPAGALRQPLGVLAILAVPVLGIFVLAPELLLRLGFGAEYADAHTTLLPLGAAFTLLAACYLASQYLLALHHAAFLWILAAAVGVEVIGLALAGDGYVQVSLVVLCVQAGALALVLVFAARARPRGRIDEPVVPGPHARTVEEIA